jgi:hypothetical protein
MIKGRWSIEWVRQFDLLHPHKGEQICTNLLRKIWQSVLKLWRQRCEQQHAECETTATQLQHHLSQKTRVLYELKPKLDRIDQLPLETPIENILALPTRTLKDWVTRTESFVKQGLQRARQRLKTSNHHITRFFPPLRNPRSQTPDNQPANTPTTEPIKLHARENFRPP